MKLKKFQSLLEVSLDQFQFLKIFIIFTPFSPEPSAKIGLLAEGDEGDGGGEGGNDPIVEPTGWDRCQAGNKCCYQFTWQGYYDKYWINNGSIY